MDEAKMSFRGGGITRPIWTRCNASRLVWCPTCDKAQKMIFDVMAAGGKNDHDAADIVCDHCKSIVATLHAPRTQKAQARVPSGRESTRDGGPSIGPSARPIGEDEERHIRKRRLLKGPKEFRDIRDKKR